MQSKHAAKFKVGDWVAPRDVATDSNDYDQGEVIAVRAYVVDVRWHVAGETYSEDPINLVRVARGV